MSADVRPDNTLICLASDRAEHLAILSSRYHVAWANRLGGTLEDRPVYSKGVCFDRFAFPDMTAERRAELAALGEELDELRSRVLTRHPHLTMTTLYNARQRLDENRPLTLEELRVHEDGHVRLISHLHRRIDAVVAKAYGWPEDVSMDDALTLLARLNRERASSEAKGDVQFLRPEYQRARHRGSVRHSQIEVPLVIADIRPDLPEGSGALASALLTELRAAGTPVEPRGLAARFAGKRGRRTQDRIEQTLAVLAVAGSVQRTDRGWYAPRR